MERRSSAALVATVLVVDEHFIVRWGLKHFLESQKGIRVVGEAGALDEAIELANLLKPAVVILDPSLRGSGRDSAVRDLATAAGGGVLAFSSRDSWDAVERFMSAGGAGFLPKRCPPSDLVKAVRAVASGRRYVCPSLRSVRAKEQLQCLGGIRTLSGREREIAVLVARGFTSRQIGDKLCVSLKTVETHRYRIFKDLGIGSRAELVNYVLEHGLLEQHQKSPAGCLA